jgi:hypothetical protein
VKHGTASQLDFNVFGVIHRAGKVWRGMIASTKGPKPAIVATREFTVGQLGQFDQWLDEHQAESVLCVLPASSVICRNCALPDAPAEQLEQALRLQAEAHLLGIAAPHRLAMGIQPSAPGETSRTGIILAWPESSTVEPPATKRPITFIPDVAALAALLNGQRPTEPLIWLDRSDGSVALALTHAGGVVLRATREDAADASAWQRTVGRMMAETALSVGHTGAFIETIRNTAQRIAGSLDANQGRLFMPPELIGPAAARLQGASADPQWWSQYGIAAGAVLARTGSLAGLTRLKQAAPIERPSRIRTALESLSRPRMAVAVVVACVLILMFGPLATSGLRLLILQFRFAGIQQELAAASKVEHQLAMYRELERQKAWPMTKLLADITTNTPLGIDLERIQISSGKDFSVSGTARDYDGRSPRQVVALMQENLRKDNLFADISVSWGNSSNLGTYKFDLSGKVPHPYLEPQYPQERDFKKKPYAWYLYPQLADSSKTAEPSDTDEGDEPALAEAGDEPAESDPAADEPIDIATLDEPVDPEASDEDPGSGARRRSSSGDLGGAAMPGAENADGPRPSEDVPPPLSEEQIKAMNPTELREAWFKVSKARKYVKGDEALSARLKKEFELITEELKKHRTGGSSGS